MSLLREREMLADVETMVRQARVLKLLGVLRRRPFCGGVLGSRHLTYVLDR